MLFLLLSLLFATVSAVPTFVFTRSSATTITTTATLTTGAGVTGFVFGYRNAAADNFITNGIMCEAVANGVCTQFSCTTAAACTLGNTVPTATDAFTAGTASATVVTVTRDVTRGTPITTLPMVYTLYVETTTAYSAVAGTVTGAVLVPQDPAALYTVAAPTFGLTFSRPTQATLATTIVPASGQTVMLGWKASALAPVPADGVICTLTAAGTCVEFTCSVTSGTQSCVAPTTSILTSNAVTTTNAIVVRNIAAGTFQPIVSPMNLAYLSTVTAGPYTPASAANQSWTEYSTALPVFVPTTPPTFPINFTRRQDTTLNISVIPPAGKTLFFGWRSVETDMWPADAVICAPGSVSTCLDVACTSASACAARASTIYITNTVSATSVALSRLLASGTVPLTATGKMWLAYDTADTAAGTTTLNASAAQSRTWSLYSADVPPVVPITPPTFTVSFTRPQDTTLNISVVPPAGKTLFFGWRSADAVTWPADAVICAPGSVSTCLDVACTSASACAARATTIYITNTVSATSVALSRLLASGTVPLTATGKMWLAYDTADTAAGTTTLNASAAQSRTWSQYTADVPAVGTNTAKTFIPSLIAGLCMILYVL